MIVAVELPESVCAATMERESDLSAMLREALAVDLYRQGRVSLGKAAEIAGVSRAEAPQLLGRHGVPIVYDVADAEADWATVNEVLGR